MAIVPYMQGQLINLGLGVSLTGSLDYTIISLNNWYIIQDGDVTASYLSKAYTPPVSGLGLVLLNARAKCTGVANAFLDLRIQETATATTIVTQKLNLPYQNIENGKTIVGVFLFTAGTSYTFQGQYYAAISNIDLLHHSASTNLYIIPLASP